MRSRDYFKKKFETTKDITTWNLYKKARNEVNNNLKQSKRDYFSTNLSLRGRPIEYRPATISRKFGISGP
jgi:hypothetical protein